MFSLYAVRSLLHRRSNRVVVGLHHTRARVATQPQVVSLSRARRIARRASGIPASPRSRSRRARGSGTTPSGQVGARRDPTRAWRAAGVALAAAATLSAAAPAPIAFAEREFYIEDIPQGLSSGDGGEKAPSLRSLVAGPTRKRSRSARASASSLAREAGRRAGPRTSVRAQSACGVQGGIQEQAVLPQRVHGDMQYHRQRKSSPGDEAEARRRGARVVDWPMCPVYSSIFDFARVKVTWLLRRASI